MGTSFGLAQSYHAVFSLSIMLLIMLAYSISTLHKEFKMKTFKSLLALGMAVAFSSSAFAQTTDAVGALKDSAKTTINNEILSQKASATSAVNSKVSSVKENVSAMKTAGTEKVTAAQANVTEKASVAKAQATEKVTTTKATAAQKAENAATKVKASSKVNINKADEKTLQSLSGIGEAKAKAIVEYRNKVGKIKSAEELSKISGIGDATVEKIAPYLTF
jgi:competence protein comEA helix-hairpin-helix repeat region